ncbi:MAG: hypothetical protein HKP30_09515, partial [Myxococcales bacterium]|nr:hypothetical protein [Myxococcales bacterium]
MSHVLPRIPLRLAPLAAVLLTVAAGPAAALTTGSVELSYATPTRSDFVSITGGGPPEESNPPLPIAATLTTPTPETPGVDDAFIGLHGEVQAEVPSGPGVYVQSVGAGVGGVDFESPFGGTIENT